MSNVLTDRADSAIPGLVAVLKVALWIFVGYAASRHVPWEDALAGTWVLTQTLRAVMLRQRPASEDK